MSLAGRHRSHAEQAPPGVAADRRLGGVDAGMGDVYPVRVQPVGRMHPLAGPLAGGDHGCCSPRHRTLRTEHSGIPATERRVHQQHHPEAASGGHHHLRDRGGHQAVDQHQLVVADRGERLARALDAPAPPPTASRRPRLARCTDHPSAARWSAEPSVVGVAAAGPRRVLDPVRDHHVHPAAVVHVARS